ncbi:MAG: hypothetical protein HY246_14690, partial [Proteobacteria bacterium]|nr:hypothetical protein [Pseudomonadota bacterium]
PVRLVPPRIVQPEQPAAPTERPAEREAAPEIEIARPPPIDADTIGLIDEAHGGLPNTLWEGSERTVVQRLLGKLPAAMMSRPALELERRVLATSAKAPTGNDPAPAKSFIGTRAERLLALGDVTGAVDLARMAPGRAGDEALSRVLLDGLWLAGDDAGGCALARSQISRFTGPYWQKCLIFCLALANDQGRAQLGLSLLREQQAEEDVVFTRLVAALGGDSRAVVDSLRQPAPLHLAMLRAARQPLPADVATTNDPAILRAITQSANAAPDLRLAVAERAEALGALAPEALAQTYEAVNLTPDQIANAPAFAQSDRGPRGRAALYRAVKAATSPVARGEALQRAYRLAREGGAYGPMARTTAPLLLEIPPSADLAGFAGDAARALLFSGRLEEARRWYGVVHAAADANPQAAAAEILLWPLLRLAGGDALAAWDAPRLTAWRTAQDRIDQRGAGERAALLATLLSATGDQAVGVLVQPALAAELPRQDASLPNPSLWLGMRAAARGGRKGETALYALAALGGEGAVGVSPYLAAAAIEALRTAGLDGEARALAREAAIAAGL